MRERRFDNWIQRNVWEFHRNGFSHLTFFPVALHPVVKVEESASHFEKPNSR